MARKVLKETCRSCKFRYDDKLNHVRMCSVHQEISTKDHVNQNGHVRKIVTGINGHAPCVSVAENANKCRKYKKGKFRPLEWYEVKK